jgi:hypothetical protein
MSDKHKAFFFFGPRKWRNHETDVSLLEYFKDLRNEGVPVNREALMSKAKECAIKETVIHTLRG